MKVAKALKRFIPILLIGMIASCGYKPRGYHTFINSHLSTLEYDPEPTIRLHQTIKDGLITAQIKLCPPCQANYKLVVSDESWHTRILAYDPNSRPIRELLTLNAHYKIISLKDNSILINRPLKIERQRQLNPQQVLADSDDKSVLQSEMRLDAAQLMLYQLLAFKPSAL